MFATGGVIGLDGRSEALYWGADDGRLGPHVHERGFVHGIGTSWEDSRPGMVGPWETEETQGYRALRVCLPQSLARRTRRGALRMRASDSQSSSRACGCRIAF